MTSKHINDILYIPNPKIWFGFKKYRNLWVMLFYDCLIIYFDYILSFHSYVCVWASFFKTPLFLSYYQIFTISFPTLKALSNNFCLRQLNTEKINEILHDCVSVCSSNLSQGRMFSHFVLTTRQASFINLSLRQDYT